MSGAPPRAGLARRLLAAVIDLILVLFSTVVLVMLFDVVEDAEDYQSSAWIGWVLLLAVASWLILNGPLLWRRRQSVGRALLGVRRVTRS